MKSFLQFILEMPESIEAEPDGMYLDDDYNVFMKPGRYDREEDYGGNADYTLKGRSWKGEEDLEFPVYHWILYHDKDDIVHMHTRGGNTEDGFFIANETAKHEDSKISGPEFYKMILHSGKVKGIQSGSHQTEGGKSIWRRMALDPELKVTHHNTKTGKQIKLHSPNKWDNNYDQDQKTHLRVQLKDG